jgi:nitroreductase
MQEHNGGGMKMNIAEAITSRRSIGLVKPDPVGRHLIEKLLEAAVWAPNHGHTEPWRFTVMTGEGRKLLGRTFAAIAAEKLAEPDTDKARTALRKAEEKAYRAPVVIAAAALPSPKAVRIEELAAVHAAVQNMLLTAHSLGLGAIWRSGEPMYHPLMKAAFGLEDDDELVGLIYIGYPYPAMEHAAAKRIPAAEKTVWLEHDSGIQVD